MNRELEDRALAYVLGELDDFEVRTLESEMDGDPELAAHVRELSLAQETLFLSSPVEEAPAEIPDLILSAGHSRQTPISESPGSSKLVSFWRSPVWAVAAVLAICAATYTIINLLDQQRQIEDLRKEIADAQALPQNFESLNIVTFAPQEADFTGSQAVALWDSDSETAYLVVGSLPALESGRAYQVWALDDTQPAPIPGDTFGNGETVLTFDSIGSVSGEERSLQFAVSIEPVGGSPSPTGPIVLVSEKV